MTSARKIGISLGLFIIFFIISSYCYADDEIIIQSYLMKGYGKSNSILSADPSVASLYNPFLLHIRADDGEPCEDSFASLRDKVCSIYKFSTVKGLTSADMTWDGKSENLNVVVLAYEHIYPIQLFPRSIKGNTLTFRVQGLRFRYGEIRYPKDYERQKREISSGDFELFTEMPKVEESIGGEKWLEKEITLSLEEPMIVVLPGGNNSYFLAIRAYKKEARHFSVGLVNTKLEYFNIRDADPVCGRIVGRGDGIEKGQQAEASFIYMGYTFMFCSQACLEKFRQNPLTCLKKSKTKYFNQVTFMGNPSFVEVHETPHEAYESFESVPSILVWPALPEVCIREEMQGTLRTELQVDQSGNVMNVRVLESLNPELDEAAVSALRQWKYNPMPKDGLTTSNVYFVDLDFKLGLGQKAVESETVNNRRSKLDSILDESAEYCRRLEDAALNYVCLERIKEIIYPGKHLMSFFSRRGEPKSRKDDPDNKIKGAQSEPGERNEYMFDYQLIRKEGRIIERRRLLKDIQNILYEDQSFQGLRRIYFNKPIYGPIGLLSKEFQPFYNYSLLRQELVGGRMALVLDAKPAQLVRGKANYGKVWVDIRDGTVLKMEIEAESLEGYERIREDYVSRGVTPLFSLEIVFGYENKGLRFPSRIVIKEAYSEQRKGQIRVSQISVDYNNYKFFTVETGTQIKEKPSHYY